MNLWQDGLIAMLAAIGLTTLVWLLVSALMHFGHSPVMSAWLVLPASGDAPDLQQSVRELERLRREIRGFPRIVIVDCGLSPQGRRLAELLAEREPRLDLCRREDFTID